MFAYGYFDLQLYETAPCKNSRGIIKFIRIYYNTNSRGFGKFFMRISLLDLLAFLKTF